MAVVLVLVTTGGCGGDGEEAPTTTVSTEPTTTRLPQGDAKGIACANLSTLELKLLNDYREEARGVVAPDDEAYRAEADVLRAEHIRLGCPGVPLKGFLTTNPSRPTLTIPTSPPPDSE